MASQRICLQGLGPEGKGLVWDSDQTLRIGRLLDLDIVLTSDSVSRHHAELVWSNDGCVARDLGSTNGTFLNGSRLGRAGQKVREGDVLQCGDVLFRVKFNRATTPKATDPWEGRLRVEHAVKQSWPDVLELSEALSQGGQAEGHARRLALLKTGRDCHHGGSLDSFAESILWETAESLNAQHGCVILTDCTTDQLTTRAAFSWQGKLEAKNWHKTELISQALERGESLLYGLAPTDPGAEAAGDSDRIIGSMICALLRSPRKQLGVLCLARLSSSEPFDQEDLHLADALALSVSGTIDNLEQVLEAERGTFIQTLTTLAQMVELRKGQVAPEPSRATDYALLLAEELRLPPQDCYYLRVGIPLVELGKIGLSDALLLKTGPLSAAEADTMKSYALKGTTLLEAIPGLSPLLPIVRNHHEHWDGTGYPDNLAGEQIPRLARVAGLAHAFAAMTSNRPYAPALAIDEAFAEVRRNAGSQFDPQYVQALLRLRPRIERQFSQRRLLNNTLTKTQLEETRRDIDLAGQAREHLMEHVGKRHR